MGLIKERPPTQKALAVDFLEEIKRPVLRAAQLVALPEDQLVVPESGCRDPELDPDQVPERLDLVQVSGLESAPGLDRVLV